VHGLLAQLVVNGVGIAAAPWCVIGVILILSAPHGLRKSLAFLLGASTSMVVIYAICSAAVGHFTVAQPSSASSAIDWAKLVAGLALLLFGVWRLRRPAQPASSPRWLSIVDRVNMPTAYAIGLVMPNPIFAAAGALQIVKAGIAPAAEAAYLVVFIAISLSSMLVPVLLYARAPVATAARLAGWKKWLAQNSGLILTVLLIGYGGLISVHALLALH
jgi:threonine/homoserine/homoserine lactone efflux protein